MNVTLHLLIQTLGRDFVNLRQIGVQQHALAPEHADAALDAFGGDGFGGGFHEVRTINSAKRSILKGVKLFDLHRLAAAEESDDDGQTDRYLGGGDG